MVSSHISRNVQRLSDNFVLASDDDGEKVLQSEKLEISIRIRPGGYVPRSGLLVAEHLATMDIHGMALDIGTGESGLLANCLLAMGASNVFASDIDPTAVQWATQASNRSQEISWHNCDLLPSGLVNGTIDIIVSNPPQMPMPYRGHSHDYGGPDGRDCIIRIIEQGEKLLSRAGKLVVLCFDFLSIDCPYGHETIIELARKRGLRSRLVARHNRSIRKGGKTEENISWIERICPGYIFRKDCRGNFYHEIFILEMSRYLV